MSQRLLIEPEHRSWLRAYRSTWLLFWLVAFFFPLGANGRATIWPLFGLSLDGLAGPSAAAYWIAVCVASLLSVWGLCRIAPVVRPRRLLVPLVLGTLAAGVTAAFGVLRALAALEGVGGWRLPAAATAESLTLLVATSAVVLVLALAIVIGGAGFVTRRWAVLGIPVMLCGLVVQAAHALQYCQGAGQTVALCTSGAAIAAALAPRLHIAGAVALALMTTLVLVMLGESARSIRHVVLDVPHDDSPGSPSESTIEHFSW